jgi:hypothetical protein
MGNTIIINKKLRSKECDSLNCSFYPFLILLGWTMKAKMMKDLELRAIENTEECEYQKNSNLLKRRKNKNSKQNDFKV